MLPWLSTFLINPALAVGTVAVGSPILIHLLSRRRFRRIRWAAMDFLLEAQRRNRRRIRLEQLILLFLRCLAVFLIAMMIARPFIRPGTVSALIGLAPRTERIVLLDDSLSMAYRQGDGAGGETVFARGVQFTRKIAEWLANEAGGDSFTVVTTSHPREPLVAAPSLSDENLRLINERLAAAQPTQLTARMPEAIAAVADLVRRAPTQANTTVYVVSDFQRSDWVAAMTPVDGGKSAGLAAPLAALADRGRPIKLFLVGAAGPAAPKNLAITGLTAAQPQIAAGVPARFDVAVSNYSPQPRREVELDLSIAHHTLPPVIVPIIYAGQTVREPVEITFPDDGSDYLHVEIAGSGPNTDGLLLDNQRTAAVEVVPAVKVLIVDGQPSSDPYRDEVFLLKTALRPEGRTASGNDLTIVDPRELDGVDLDSLHLVILANVDRLSETSQRNLEQFVQGGGGLVIFAGELLDADFYNGRLYDKGRGLLPLPIEDVVQAVANAAPLGFGEWSAGHAIMRPFVDQLAAVLRQVRVFAFVGVNESSDKAGGERASSAPASQPARSEAVVAARLNDSNNSPMIVERPYGRGRCVFVATSCDQQWNDWAANFSYVPMMLELVQYAARRSDTISQAVVGAPLECRLDRRAFRLAARVRTPGYPVEPEISLQPKTGDVDGTPLVFAETAKSGLYRFELTTVFGESATRFAAVNPDPTESDLTRAGPAELATALSDIKFEYTDGAAALAAQTAGARQEIWWPLLLAAAAVLMIEHSLAWWFGTRGA